MAELKFGPTSAPTLRRTPSARRPAVGREQRRVEIWTTVPEESHAGAETARAIQIELRDSTVSSVRLASAILVPVKSATKLRP
jgi:hypothetical protein